MHGGDEEGFAFGEAAGLEAEDIGVGVGLAVAGEAVGGGPVDVDVLSHCVGSGGCGGEGK